MRRAYERRACKIAAVKMNRIGCEGKDAPYIEVPAASFPSFNTQYYYSLKNFCAKPAKYLQYTTGFLRAICENKEKPFTFTACCRQSRNI